MAIWEEIWGQDQSRLFREKHPEVADTLDALSGLDLIFPVPEHVDVYFSQLISESWREGLINDAEHASIVEELRPYLTPLEEARLMSPKRIKTSKKT